MKMRKLVAAGLVGAMVCSLAGCGGSGSAAENKGSEAKGEGSYAQVTMAYSTFNNIPAAEDLDKVEEAINEITREKIGAEITLMPIGIADYSSKVSLALQGGEKIDIVKLNVEIEQIVAREQVLRDEIAKIIAEIEGQK